MLRDPARSRLGQYTASMNRDEFSVPKMAHERLPNEGALRAEPASLTVAGVLSALLERSAVVGEPIAAHLWTLEPDSRLHLVESVFSARPGVADDATVSSSLLRSVDEARVVVEPLRRVTTIDSDCTVWRLALPVDGGETHAVAAVDFAAEGPPSVKRLRRSVRDMAGYFTGALALHAQHAQAQAAQELTDALGGLAAFDVPEAIVSECLDAAIRLVRADSGSVMLLDTASQTLHIVASIGLPPDVIASAAVSQGEGVSGWVLATGQPLAVEDLDAESFRTKKFGRRSAISVPLGDVRGVLGVLNVARHGSRERLTREDLEMMQTLGRFTAIVLRRAQRACTSHELYFGTLASLATAMESRNPHVGLASQRVADLATEIGEVLELSPSELETLRVAALLHDVGMSAAGETVEVSGRPLSTVEWGMLKMHPLVAVDILSEVPALAEVVPIVRHHHERWDGSGYVAGIAKDEIPLSSRILSVADAFVAMTSERPYRPSMSSSQALAELAANAGTQFDPRVVRVLAEQVLGSGTGAAPSEPVRGDHNDRPEAAVGEGLFRAGD